MLPNEKLSLLTLKNLFDEGGANRITPKLLRDFLVSTYGSRYTSRVVDSVDLTEEEDIVMVRMTEGSNFIRLPDSKGVDNSDTPYQYKRYTVYNESAEFEVRAVTMPNDRFQTDDQQIILQELTVGPKEVWEFFCFDERWYAFAVGAVPEELSTMPTIASRVRASVGSGAETTVDVVDASISTVKWIIRTEYPTDGLYGSLEVMASKRAVGVDFVEHGVIGDELAVSYTVGRNGDDEIELNIKNNFPNLIELKILRYSIG